VYMKDGVTDWGWGIVISAAKQKVAASSALAEVAVEEEERETQWVLNVFIPTEPGSVAKQQPRPPAPGEKTTEGNILPMALTVVQKISKVRSNMPEGDPKSEDSRRALLKTLRAIAKKFDGAKKPVPLLDPVAEMKIPVSEIGETLECIKDLEEQQKKNNLYSSPLLAKYVQAFEKKVKLHTRIQDMDKKIAQTENMVMADDLNAMTRVLRRLEFIDKNDVVQLKGRLACELTSADEILLTEIVFQNVFAGMEANHIVALISCLVFEEKSDDPITNNLQLMQAFETMKGIARNVAEVMVENKIPIVVEEYVEKLKPQLMDVVLGWLEGKRFYEIMNQCHLYEGSVVRVIRRLEELIRELASAAKSIGNTELEEKLVLGRKRLKRGIIFASSLYL